MAMDWLQPLFSYCERGIDTSTWAEPLNLVTTGLWLLVGIWLWVLVRTQGFAYQRPSIQYVLVLLIVLSSVADFGVHIQANQADKVLVLLSWLIFSGLYFYLMCTRFLRLKHRSALIITLAVGVVGSLVAIVPCILGYCLPASALGLFPLVVLVVITHLLHQRNHPATRWLAGASVLLALGLVANVLDTPLCQATMTSAGYVLGWHYIWHMVSAIGVFILTQAMIQFYRYAAVGEY